MTKTISNLRSGLTAAVITTGLFLGAASATFGASASDTLALSGEIHAIATLSIASTAPYSDLNLGTDASDLPVGTATEICNDTAGYTVSLSSANGVAASTNTAFLKSSELATDTLSYTIKYNDVAVVFVAGVDTDVFNATGETDADGTDHVIKISYTSIWLPAGTYTDTLTLTIAAK